MASKGKTATSSNLLGAARTRTETARSRIFSVSTWAKKTEPIKEHPLRKHHNKVTNNNIVQADLGGVHIRDGILVRLLKLLDDGISVGRCVARVALGVESHPSLKQTAGIALGKALDGDTKNAEEASVLRGEHGVGAFVPGKMRQITITI